MSGGFDSRLYPRITMEELDALFAKVGTQEDLRRRTTNKGRAVGLAEGRVEGRAEGRVKGRTEGRAEERLSILHQVLQGKFGNISEAQLASVLEHRDDSDIFTRIIKADTVDELLLDEKALDNL